MSQAGYIGKPSSSSSEPVLEFTGGTGTVGTFPVLPNGSGAIQLTSTTGTVTITGSANSIDFASSGGGTGVMHLTGNSGGIQNPDGSSNFNVLGTGSITTVGTANTITTQLTGLTNHAIQVGAGTATLTQVGPSSTSGQLFQSKGASADPAFTTATYPSTTTANQILYSSATNTVTGLASANNSVLITNATGVPSLLALTTDGELIIGSASGAPAAANLTAGTGITITNSANGITIAASAAVGLTITGNSGGAIAPSASNWNTLGAGSITISGAGSTLTTQLTGLTNHAIQVGAGTATLTQLAVGSTGQVLQANSAADPTWSTATYPSTTTVSQILYSSSNNVVAGLATGNNGTLITNGSGIPSISSTLPNAVQLNITNVGTVTAGTWNASLISLTYGGTNANLTASNGGIFYSTASAGAILSGTATAGQMLQSGANAAPTWSTTTYPATNAINTLLYASSANVMAALATTNDGVLITSNTGVPSWLANGTTGQVLTATTGSSPSWTSLTTGSITINGDTGSVTGTTLALHSTSTAGSSTSFSGSGTTLSFNVTDVGDNVLIGASAGNGTLSGTANAGIGFAIFNGLTTGSSNCGIGYACLDTLTTGSHNMGIGQGTLDLLKTGIYNIAIGNAAGSNYTGAESSNILLNNSGTLGESNVLRFGSGTGTADQQLAKTFISGINGVTSSNPVVVTTNSSTDQMGVDNTNFHILSTGLQLKGNNTNTPPPAGYIGEQIRSFVPKGSAVSLTSGVAANVTSISLTAGIWDVSIVCGFNGATAGTYILACISTVSATATADEGDNNVQFPFLSQATSEQSLCIPAYRMTLATTTTVYLVAQSIYSLGSAGAFGRISATRVG